MSIYSQNIVEHYKNPRNFGKIENPDCAISNENRSCGEEMAIYMNFEENKNILKEIKFEGYGSVISIGTMSILTDELVGMKIDEIEKIGIEEIQEIIGIEIGANKVKNALFGIETIKSGLLKFKKEKCL